MRGHSVAELGGVAASAELSRYMYRQRDASPSCRCTCTSTTPVLGALFYYKLNATAQQLTMPSTFAIWFRLFVANDFCRCTSNIVMFVATAIPITWIFTFIPVCRVAADTGATGYWWQLGTITAYSAVCFAAWAAIFFPCLTVRACADCDCCDFRPAKTAQAPAAVARKPKAEPEESTPAPTIIARNDIKKSCITEDCMCCVTGSYSLLLIAAAPIALLCTIPAIMINTTSYGAAFGLTCAFAAIYAAAVFAVFIAPWAAWGAALATHWAVCGFWNHLMGTCRDAAASADGYAETV